MAIDKYGKTLPKGIRFRGSGYEGRITFNRKTYTVHGKTVSKTQKNMIELQYKLRHDAYALPSQLTPDDWFFVWPENFKKRNI